MERVYTLIQPAGDGTFGNRVVSAKVATIVEDFDPSLTFLFSIDEDGKESTTNDIDELKRMTAQDNGWNVADDGLFLRKCAEYEKNFNTLKLSGTFENSKKDPVNPKHYQACFVVPGVVELQWLEHIQYHHRFRDPDGFKTALELQARKYLDRLGGKDEDSQEIMKAVWYLKYLAAYIRNGNKPIRVEDVDKILSTPCV